MSCGQVRQSGAASRSHGLIMGCAGVARDCVGGEWYRLAAKYVGGGVRYR